jgi:DNA-binding HxlR family transcriptional regulator
MGSGRPPTRAENELAVGAGARTLEAMTAYGQFCPVALGAEVFAERWTPLVVRELLNGANRFGELTAGLPDMSPRLLVQRLASLERAGIVTRRRVAGRRGFAYGLTAAGEDLRGAVEALGAWGYRWSGDTIPEESLNPGLLLWFLRRRMASDRLPERRIVLRFDFHGARTESHWLIMNRPEVDICHRDPGFEVDLVVTADVAALAQVYLGRLEFDAALADGLVAVEGPRALIRAFPHWWGVSPFARYRDPAIPLPGAFTRRAPAPSPTRRQSLAEISPARAGTGAALAGERG